MKYRYVIYPSETEVIDQRNTGVVRCPTEDEAWEYIQMLEQEEDEDDKKRRYMAD